MKPSAGWDHDLARQHLGLARPTSSWFCGTNHCFYFSEASLCYERKFLGDETFVQEEIARYRSRIAGEEAQKRKWCGAKEPGALQSTLINTEHKFWKELARCRNVVHEVAIVVLGWRKWRSSRIYWGVRETMRKMLKQKFQNCDSLVVTEIIG